MSVVSKKMMRSDVEGNKLEWMKEEFVGKKMIE